jgi:rubrerythrin
MLTEVGEMAVQMELNGVDFYKKAARTTKNNDTQMMLVELAGMELAHANSWRAVVKQAAEAAPATVDPEVADLFHAWLDTEVFAHHGEEMARIAESGNLADVCRKAIQVEKETVSFYTGIRDVVTDEHIREMLDQIVHEELQHVVKLSKALRSLTYPFEIEE